jgi:hypothetical protein
MVTGRVGVEDRSSSSGLALICLERGHSPQQSWRRDTVVLQLKFVLPILSVDEEFHPYEPQDYDVDDDDEDIDVVVCQHHSCHRGGGDTNSLNMLGLIVDRKFAGVDTASSSRLDVSGIV